MKAQNFIVRFRKSQSSFGVMGQMMLELELQAMSSLAIETLKSEIAAKPRLAEVEKNLMTAYISKHNKAAA